MGDQRARGNLQIDLALPGAERDRTANLCVANAALSQLSYGPGKALGDGRDGNSAADAAGAASNPRGGLDAAPLSGARSWAFMQIDVRRILVPVDFSESTPPLLEWAAHLAEEHGSSITLLHAYHLPVEFQQLEGAYLPPDFWASVKAEAEESLDRLADRCAARGRGRDGGVRGLRGHRDRRRGEGTPDADLIVIGTHGLSGPEAPAAGQHRRARGAEGAVSGAQREDRTIARSLDASPGENSNPFPGARSAERCEEVQRRRPESAGAGLSRPRGAGGWR